MADNNTKTLKYDIAKSFQRTKDFPLDLSSVFFSKDAAVAYATGGSISYLGQIIAVVNSAATQNKVSVFKIGLNSNNQRELQELGGIIDRQITIGGTVVEPGTPIADVLEIIDDVITPKDPIIVDGEVIVQSGVTTNEALQIIVENLIEKIGDAGIDEDAFHDLLKQSISGADEDVTVTEEGDVLLINVNGISNPNVIELDKDRYITLNFGSGVQPITAMTPTGDYTFEETIPEGVWRVNSKPEGVTTYQVFDNGNPPAETIFFETGYKIKIDGLNQVDSTEVEIVFSKIS